MADCTHTRGATLCFECFKAGMERTRARREAYAQKMLPFETADRPEKPLSEQALAHRRRMLAYLESMRQRGA